MDAGSAVEQSGSIMREFIATVLWMAAPAILFITWPLNCFTWVLISIMPTIAGAYHKSWETGIMSAIITFALAVAFGLPAVIGAS